MIKDSKYMLEEQIILLIKENRHEEAIRMYVDSNEFDRAEEFCLNKDKSLGLITILLTIYFKYYDDFMADAKKLLETGDISGQAKAKERA